MWRIQKHILLIPHYYRVYYGEFWKAISDMELKLLGSPIPIPDDIPKTKYSQKLKNHSNHYKYLDETMTKFFNSKPVEGCVYGEQLMFISGPDQIGKSTFIRDNFQKFKQLKSEKRRSLNLSQYQQIPFKIYEIEQQRLIPDNSQTLMINLEFGQNKDLSFNSFVDYVQNSIKQEIIKTQNSFKQKRKVLLTQAILFKLAIIQYHPQFLRTYAKDALHMILNDSSEILYSETFKEKLSKSQIFKTSKKQFSKQSFSKQIHQLTLIFQQNNKTTTVESAIQLYLLIFKQIQYQNRPSEYSNSYYRTGIETTSFLLSILDYFVGTVQLHKGNYIRPKFEKVSNEFQLPESDSIKPCDQEFFCTKQQKQQQQILKPSRRSILQTLPIPTTCIESGEHIDTVVSFTNLFQISCSKDKQFLDWFDYIILRSNTRSGMRKGVPIIVELHHSNYHQDIFNLGSLQSQNPLIVNLSGYRAYKENQSIFKLDIRDRVFYKIWYALGHHPNLWRDAVLELQSKGKSIYDYKQIKNLQVAKKDKIIAHSLINKAFTNPRSVEIMHLPQFRFKMADLLSQFWKKQVISRQKYNVTYQYIDENPVSYILSESGLLNVPYYQQIFCPVRSTYIYAFPQAIKSLRKNHSKWSYFSWFIKDGTYLTSIKSKHLYQSQVFLTLIQPTYHYKNDYQATPSVSLYNKVSEDSYQPKAETRQAYQQHSSIFYSK